MAKVRKSLTMPRSLISQSDSLTIIGLIVTLVLFVVVPNQAIKIILLCFGLALLALLVAKSEYTSGWTRGWKIGIWLLVSLLICLIAGNSILNESKPPTDQGSFPQPTPKPKDPHFKITSMDLQPLELGKKIKIQFFFQNDGDVNANLQYIYTIAFVDHHSNDPEIWEKAETTFYAMSRQKMDDSTAQKGNLDVDPHDPSSALMEGLVYDKKTANNKVIIATGVFRYAGRPDIPQVEFCKYWLPNEGPRTYTCKHFNSQ